MLLISNSRARGAHESSYAGLIKWFKMKMIIRLHQFKQRNNNMLIMHACMRSPRTYTHIANPEFRKSNYNIIIIIIQTPNDKN